MKEIKNCLKNCSHFDGVENDSGYCSLFSLIKCEISSRI